MPEMGFGATLRDDAESAGVDVYIAGQQCCAVSTDDKFQLYNDVFKLLRNFLIHWRKSENPFLTQLRHSLDFP